MPKSNLRIYVSFPGYVVKKEDSLAGEWFYATASF